MISVARAASRSSGNCCAMPMVRSASSRIETQLPGLPMLKMPREARPFAFSMMVSSASIASSI